MIASEQVFYAVYDSASQWSFLCRDCFEELTGDAPGAKDLAIAAPARVVAEFEQWQREGGGCQWCELRFATTESAGAL